MKMIVGLGNPGKKYEKTRHNVGWMVIDEIAKKEGIELKLEEKFDAEIVRHKINGEDVLLVKPNTFMNLSGQAVRKIAEYFRIENKNIYIVNDDIDLPIGWVRIRTSGRDGGHRGLRSIFDELGTEEIVRIKIGVSPVLDGQTDQMIPVEARIFVLQEFGPKERIVIKKAIEKVIEKIYDGMDTKMLDNETISIL